MKKYLCLFASVIFLLLSACSQNQIKVGEQYEHREIIASGKHYSIYKGNGTRLCYYIYDATGKTVLSERTDRPLKIDMLNDDIVDIEIGMGTGIIEHKYYGVEEGVFSQVFTYVLCNSDRLVAYIDVPTENPFEDRKVIVQDIFDKNLFYEEFQMDFSKNDTPVLDARFSSDGTSLQLTYLSGEKEVEMSTLLYLSR